MFACSGSVFGQLGTPLSQYSGNQIVYNPGYAGMFDLLSINLSVHQSWVGLRGAPRMVNFNGHAPFKNKKHAWGWTYQHEKWGNLRGNMVYGNYAYKVYLHRAVLNLGVQAGVFHHQIDWDAIEYVTHPEDRTLGKGKTADIRFDANVGAYYMTANWYMGVSALHLNQPKYNIYELEGDRWYSQRRTQYFLMGGYNMDVDEDWSLRPEVFMRYVETAPMSVNVGAQLFYQKDYGIGVTYMSGQQTVSFSMKIGLAKGLRIGYSYDVMFGVLRPYQKGSHEISVNYTTRSWKDKDETADVLW